MIAFTGSLRVAATNERASTAAIGFVTLSSVRSGGVRIDSSVSMAILHMVFTASTGYLPDAVSPLSIIASVL